MEQLPVYAYKYRDDLYRVVRLHTPIKRADGLCLDFDKKNTKKLSNNICRARHQIEAYALCNDFDYFGTFTLDQKLRDRSDLDQFNRDLLQFVRDSRKRYGSDIQGLFVPELHKKGDAWHMHSLVKNLPVSALEEFQITAKLPKHIKFEIEKGRSVFDWPDYRKRFGFCDLEPIGNRDACARYLTKYVTKGMQGTATHIPKGNHLYYVTQGLNLPEKIESTCLGQALSGFTVSNVFDYGLDKNGNPTSDPERIRKSLGTIEWWTPSP